MWLSTDERRLLAGYYSLLGGIAKRKSYEIADLTPLLKICGHKRRVAEYGQSDTSSEPNISINQLKKDVKRFLKRINRIKAANALLVEREMINITEHQHVYDVILVELTLQGYDLGKKYASLWKSSSLIYQECRKHWLWLAISFLAGVICKSVIDVIIDRFTNGL